MPDDMHDITPEILPTEGELIEPARRAINAGLRPWRPGQSGNINGASKVIYRARKIFGGASEALTDRLIYLALHAEDERVSAMCTIAGLGIAGLRPNDYDPKTDAEERMSHIDVERWTAEQREQARALLDAATSHKDVEP